MASVDIDQVYELLDRCIIYLTKDSWADKWKVQKGVFYFFWLYSVDKKMDFKEIADKLEIEPDKHGPYGKAIDGEVEGLIKDGFLSVRNPEEKDMLIKSSESGISELLNNLREDEEILLSEVKNLIDRLNSAELLFFVYFNPYIPNEIKHYFTSRSEIIRSLVTNKEKYVKRLLKLKLIDEIAAKKIMKETK